MRHHGCTPTCTSLILQNDLVASAVIFYWLAGLLILETVDAALSILSE
jgi:hypothetical protein